MEIISRISKGSKMDQIYLPKNRIGMLAGDYVAIRILNQETKEIIKEKPFLYCIDKIEPIKLEIINRIFKIITENIFDFDNMIITGSFLEKGFNFNDVDILLVAEKADEKQISKKIHEEIGVIPHILVMNSKTLIEGLSTDPVYEHMISRCISKNRIVFNIKRKINYKLLDLHLLKSKTLIDNFGILNGREKYYLTKNMIAILLFLEGEKINNGNINKRINKELKINSEDIKNNLLNEKEFLKNYKTCYNKIFDLVMGSIKNEPKQK